LPAPGDGSFDWRGFLDPQLWPSVVDPSQGFVVSWNNKPQADWPDSGDGVLWGATQRMRQPQSLLTAASRLSPDDTWQVARRTGELDLRDTLGFAQFLTGLAARSDLSAVERAAVAQVAAWDGTAFYPDGAERNASGAETGKVRAPGFAVMSAWFHALLRRAGQPVFEPVTGNADTATGVESFTQTPGTTSPEFEFFDDYDYFLYNMMAGRTKSAANWFGAGTAQDVSKAALDDAVAALGAAQGGDPSKWRAAMPQINFMALDVATIASIPWENRGTWGQIVAFDVGREAAPSGAGGLGGPAVPRPLLPATGGPLSPLNGAAVTTLAVAIVGSAWRRHRRRSEGRGVSGPRFVGRTTQP
jgi:penicillin amidase